MINEATDYRRRACGFTLALMSALALSRSPAQTAPDAAVPAAVEAPGSIRAAAQSYVRSLIPPSAGEATIAVGALDSRLRLAQCAPKELTASLPPGMGLQARSTIGVTCAGPVHWTVYVPVTVASKINVLVLTHAVARDTRLTATDVSIETRTTAGPGTAYLSAPGELSGRTVRRPLAAGTVLAVEMFTPDLIVRRGQQVTLLSRADSIEVRASGRAMADAPAGARIQVQNLSSMRVVEGVVESADLVRIAR